MEISTESMCLSTLRKFVLGNLFDNITSYLKKMALTQMKGPIIAVKRVTWQGFMYHLFIPFCGWSVCLELVMLLVNPKSNRRQTELYVFWLHYNLCLCQVCVLLIVFFSQTRQCALWSWSFALRFETYVTILWKPAKSTYLNVLA